MAQQDSHPRISLQLLCPQPDFGICQTPTTTTAALPGRILRSRRFHTIIWMSSLWKLGLKETALKVLSAG